MKELGFSPKAAFAGAFFVLCDNALLIQSRFILLDIMLVFFIFLAFFLYCRFMKCAPLTKKWYLSGIALGVALGAAISIKWIGAGIFALDYFSPVV